MGAGGSSKKGDAAGCVAGFFARSRRGGQRRAVLGSFWGMCLPGSDLWRPRAQREGGAQGRAAVVLPGGLQQRRRPEARAGQARGRRRAFASAARVVRERARARRLRRILTDQKEQGELFKFLKTEFAEELLDCYRAIHAYKGLFKKDHLATAEESQAARKAEATRINDVYCKPGAEFQVNLSAKLVRKLKKDMAVDANYTSHLFDKISDDLVLMIAKDKLKRFVEARKAEEKAAIEEAEKNGGTVSKKNLRATQAARVHTAVVDEFPHRFLAPDYFRGQLGLKDLAYPPIDDDYQTPLHRFSCGAVSTHGQNHGQYKINQDRCLVAYPFKNGRDAEGAASCLFLCADGHGPDGHYVADYVVKRVMDEMAKACEAKDSDPLKAFGDCYDVADKNLTDFDELGLDRQSSGTTCVGALLVGDDLWVASTGDAKIVLGQVKDGDPPVDLEDNAKDEALPSPRVEAPDADDSAPPQTMRRRSTATEVSEKCNLQAVQLSVEHKITDATEIQRIEEAGGVVEPAPGYACDRI